jgi:hypothetical protein
MSLISRDDDRFLFMKRRPTCRLFLARKPEKNPSLPFTGKA